MANINPSLGRPLSNDASSLSDTSRLLYMVVVLVFVQTVLPHISDDHLFELQLYESRSKVNAELKHHLIKTTEGLKRYKQSFQKLADPTKQCLGDVTEAIKECVGMVFEAIWRCLEQMAEAVKECVASIRKSQSDEKKESSHEQDNSDSHEIGSTGGKGAMQARPQNNNQDHSTPNDAVSRDANDNSLSIMIRSGTSAAAEENETRALFSELPGYIPPTPPGNATASFRAELRKRLLEVGQVRPN